MMRVLFPTFACASVANSYTVFRPSCTTASQATNFVYPPNTRGTLDILWTCLFTLIACTWTIQHLNVPRQRNGQDHGWFGDLKWQSLRFWTSLKWMLVTMIAPELLLAKSWQDLAVASAELPSLRKFASMDRVNWTLTHSLFADMGGFVIVGHTGREPEALEKTDIGLGGASAWTPYTDMARDSIVRIRAIIPFSTPTPAGSRYRPHHDPFHLTAAGILRLRKSGQLPKLPFVSVSEIEDKSKSDAFARTVSILQIAWISIQVIVRAVHHLPISQLEIAVVAFSVCAIIIYILCWSKPKGVSVPYTLLSFPREIPSEIIDAVLQGGSEMLMRPMLSTLFDFEDPLDSRLLGGPIPNDSGATRDMGEADPWHNLIGLTLACAIFGGLHLAAWNFEFPTTIEQTIWRAAGIYCTAFMLVFYFSYLMFGSLYFIRRWLARLLAGLYVLARLFLLVEMFRTLCFLPPEAYLSTWATNIPHLS